jgi:hypothetical protein
MDFSSSLSHTASIISFQFNTNSTSLISYIQDFNKWVNNLHGQDSSAIFTFIIIHRKLKNSLNYKLPVKGKF